MIGTCANCKYDWRQNPLDIVVELDAAQLPPQPTPYCPVCGSEHPGIALDAIGAAHTSGAAVTVWEGLKPRHLRFTGARTLRAEDAVFAGVPVFSDAQDGVSVPDLPVRPEAFELVDIGRYRRERAQCRGRIDHETGRYRARIPFVGRQTLHEVDLPLVGAALRPTTRAEEDAVRGFELGIWPKVRSPHWRTFIVHGRAALDTPAAQALQVFVLGHDDEATVARTVAATGHWRRVEPLGFAGFGAGTDGGSTRFFRALAGGGQPRAVAVTVRADWGGVFVTAGVNTTANRRDTLDLGLDFGTSNSCVSFRSGQGDEPRIMAAQDLTAYFVEPPRDGTQDARDYAPFFPRRVFGDTSDLFPSELLTTLAAARVATMDDTEIGALVPGVDYAIPGADVRWDDTSAESHTLQGLKWGSDIGRPKARFRATSAHVVAYLKALLLQSVAGALAEVEAIEGAPEPAAVQVAYGYPGRWSDQEIKNLEANLRASLGGPGVGEPLPWSVGDWYDAKYSTGDKVVEAFAASRVAGGRADDATSRRPYRLRLLVDIGGGSTDIAGIWAAEAPNTPENVIEYLTSLKYAGDDLIRAFDGNGELRLRCFSTELDLTSVRRRIRVSGAQADLFDYRKQKMAQVRATAFYGQLIELLARMAAATVLNGQDARRNGDDSRDGLHIEIVRLGNGWGLASMISQVLDSFLADQIQARIHEIISGAGRALSLHEDAIYRYRDNQPPPLISVSVHQVRGHHPKHAVALGVLQQGAKIDQAHYASDSKLNPQSRYQGWGAAPGAATAAPALSDLDDGRERPWEARSIVGLPTVMRTRQSGDRYVAWWQRVETKSGSGAFYCASVHHPKLGEDAIGYSWTQSCFETAGLPFPQALIGVGEAGLDAALDRARPDLMATISGADGWFMVSALERLLEGSLCARLVLLS